MIGFVRNFRFTKMLNQWCGGNATSKEQTQAEVRVADSSGIGSIFAYGL
jgi:hypothetical protein